MKWYRKLVGDKILQIEVGFFLFYFFLFNILTDIEYKLVEPPHPGNHLQISLRIVYGIVQIMPAWILYKLLIQALLFKKRYLNFCFWLIVYLVCLNFYELYTNGLITLFTFLPDDVLDSAQVRYNTKVILHFGGTMYMLREYMVLTFFAYFIRSIKHERQLNQLKQQQLNAELSYLKIQLQPHFFFNTLNNIYSLALQQSADTAPLVAKHAEMMRYILYNSSQKLVSLKQEVGFLRNYTEVEAVRYPKDILIEFETQGISNTALIEPLLLLPFIENTFKHGLREELNAGYIKIILCQVENELSLEVSNSKPMQDEQQSLEKGIGLENVKKRLSLLYPDTHHLEINEDDKSFNVYLTLTLHG